MNSTKPQIMIREYRADDAPAMAQLFYDSTHSLGPRRYTPEQVSAWAPAPADPGDVHTRASDGRTTFVAIDAAEEVVAYGDLEVDGHIDHLYCRPDAAGAGVASVLLDELISRARLAGVPKLYVEASELARSLFERKGFTLLRRCDFEVRGVPIHNYAMQRFLN